MVRRGNRRRYRADRAFVSRQPPDVRLARPSNAGNGTRASATTSARYTTLVPVRVRFPPSLYVRPPQRDQFVRDNEYCVRST